MMSKIDFKNVPDPMDYPGFLIWQKANAWEKFINSKLQKFGLTQSEILQLISLVILTQKKSEVTQVDLAEYTGVSAMGVSKTLKLLEKKKLITREEGTDSRSKSLGCTETGLEVLIDSAVLLREANIQFFPKNDQDQFIKYLKNIN
jgi:DNA-binding MarR family transcriptional regulator